MSVLIVTSVGDVVVDLHTDRCPLTTKNFLKLCKMKYYNGCLFHKVEKDFMAQTGDPTGTGTAGDSLYKFLYGEQARFFDDEIHPDLKHSKTGTLAMASAGKNCNASQFYFTLRDDLDYLDGKHTVFGVVEEAEGLDTLAKINEAYVDDKGRPFKDIRIKHTYILDDPFDDPTQLADFIPEKSPEGKPHDEIAEERLEDSWVPMDETLVGGELEEMLRAKEAHTNAAILESVGDIPDVDIRPPENVLFVCKLNPVTEDEDLFTIFSRFGTVTSADVIRDYKTGDSLCYAFIEFETNEACERAYYKMDNTLIDDRRIHVDFSQSVAKLWGQFRHGKKSNAGKGGCFKCGASDHIARDCEQGSGNKQDGQKYVLKNDDTQRGGDDRKRYDMLFDEENLKDNRELDHEGQQPTKRQKTGRGRSADPVHKDYDKHHPERRHDYERSGSRHSAEQERNNGSKSHDRHNSENRVEERSEVREPRDHRRNSGSGRHGKDEGDYKRSSETDRHRRESHYERKDEGDYRRSSETDRHRRESHCERKDEGDYRRSSETDRHRRESHYERKDEGDYRRSSETDRHRRESHYERKSRDRERTKFIGKEDTGRHERRK